MNNPRNLPTTCYIQTTLLIFFALIQSSWEFCALFEKIYDGEPILSIFSVIGEDLQHRCFSRLLVLCEYCVAVRY